MPPPREPISLLEFIRLFSHGIYNSEKISLYVLNVQDWARSGDAGIFCTKIFPPADFRCRIPSCQGHSTPVRVLTLLFFFIEKADWASQYFSRLFKVLGFWRCWPNETKNSLSLAVLINFRAFIMFQRYCSSVGDPDQEVFFGARIWDPGSNPCA